MSKKRKHPNRKRGGRYTPPGGGATEAGSGSSHAPEVLGGAGLGISGALGLDAEDDDDRLPVTITLPKYGTWTIPQAFALWLDSEDLVEEFDELICRHRDSQIQGDVMSEFLRDRVGVPGEVQEAVAGYSEFLDQHFGRPV